MRGLLCVGLTFLTVATAYAQAPPETADAEVAKIRARLDERLAQFAALQAEIAELERRAGVPQRQFSIRVQWIEVSHTKLKNAGYPFGASVNPRDAADNDKVLDEWLKQKIASRRFDQTLAVIDGRPSATRRENMAAGPDGRPVPDTAIEVRPTVLPDGKVLLEIDYRMGSLDSRTAHALPDQRPAGVPTQHVQTSLELEIGQSGICRSAVIQRAQVQRRGVDGAKSYVRNVNEIEEFLLITLEPSGQPVPRSDEE